MLRARIRCFSPLCGTAASSNTAPRPYPSVVLHPSRSRSRKDHDSNSAWPGLRSGNPDSRRSHQPPQKITGHDLLVPHFYLIRCTRAIDSAKPTRPAKIMTNAKSWCSKGISCRAVNLPLTGESDLNKMRASSPRSITSS